MATNRLNTIRKTRGLTATQLAQKIGVSASYLSSLARTRRKMSPKMKEKLAAALGCLPEDIVGADVPANTQLMDIWAMIPVERRDLAARVLESFTKP